MKCWMRYAVKKETAKQQVVTIRPYKCCIVLLAINHMNNNQYFDHNNYNYN